MGRRYLFGPIDGLFADQNLHKARERAECVAFGVGDGCDLKISLTDNWDAVLSRLPRGWQPDFLVLNLAYTLVPPCLLSAPLPIISIAGDWNLLWHTYRRCIPACDLVLSDTVAVQTMQRAGFKHGRFANVYGCQRVAVEELVPAAKRDIDLLFVGNLNPAVQRERMPWIARLAPFARRWRVLIATGVFGNDYRALLNRTRIVFNRSIAGACNVRAIEATVAGALLFQEVENREIECFFERGKEYIPYGPNDLENLLTYFLENEDQRCNVAEAGQRRAQRYSFAELWNATLEQLDEELIALPRPDRQKLTNQQILWLRQSQMLNTATIDPTLASDIQEALLHQPRSAALHHALAVAQMCGAQRHAIADISKPLHSLHNALHHDPTHVMASLNMAELLACAGQKQPAINQARQALGLLNACGTLSTDVSDSPHIPLAFDHFRVEWERAAWCNAGYPKEEQKSKIALLRWRLHGLLASLTDDLTHYYEAAAACPELPPTKAALGCALARANHFSEAASHLERGLAGNPFDLSAADALHQVLGEIAAWPQQQRMAHSYHLLHCAAPTTVPPRSWFAPGVILRSSSPSPEKPGGIVWEGGFAELHSLALVNRELSERLIHRGYEVSVLPSTDPRPLGPPLPLPAVLANALNRQLAHIAVHVRHQWPPRWNAPPQGHWVLMQPWEFGSLPKEWIGPLQQQVDEVWVPSSWVRMCFIQSGVPAERVHVIPNGVNVELLEREHRPYPLRTTKRFKFLFVGGTIHRKGIDILLKAYAESFSSSDDVCLVIKDAGGATFYKGQTAEKQISELQKKSAPEIEYLTQDMSAEEVAGLYQTCDCLVHPYRGEGFGLPIAEAMASGLPVVVTGYGAALDFCDETRSFLLPARLGWFNAKRLDHMETVDFPWLAEPDVARLRYYMRQIFDNPTEARLRGKAAAVYIRQHFSWDRAVDALAVRLQQLQNTPVRRLTKSKVTTTSSKPRVPSCHQTKAIPRGSHRVVSSPSGVQKTPKSLAAIAAKTGVSLCVIVKNEEHHLEACLLSVADLVDEMIVVDTGSTDRTKEIAQEAGARVYDFQWVDSFAAARNESLGRATGQWIFWLDADEVLDESNRQRLRKLFANLEDENVAYVMRQYSQLESTTHAAAQVDQVRLFRNRPEIRWQYRVHEQILLSVRKSGGDVRLTDIVIDHAGFSDPSVQGPKVDRNLRLLEMELQEQPNDSFVLYNLGAVRLTQGCSTQALEYFRRSLENARPGDVLIRKLHALIARAHHQKGDKEAAWQACCAGLEEFPDDGELLFWQAMLLREQQDLAGAAASLECVLKARPSQHFTSVDAGLYGYRARHFLAEVYREQGRLDEAQEQWQSAVAECPGFTPAWLELAKLAFLSNRWPDLEKALVHLDKDPQMEVEAMVLRGRSHLARKEFAAAKATLQAAITKAPEALLPRILLSHALLQEGVDWGEAEKALLDVLQLEPDDHEAQHNLSVLRQQHPELSYSLLAAGDSAPDNEHRQQRRGNGSIPNVSLCMIVRNEELNLSACLDSVADLVDEIIVVDTGSTDATKEIALRHGAKVFDFPWVDSFAAARNESLKHATGRWIFWLDADDRLEEQNRAKLRKLFSNLPNRLAGYVMKCLCLPDGNGTETIVDHMRLFRNHPQARWTFRVHEQILPALRSLKADVRWSDVIIHHTGYQDATARQRKLQRDLRLLQLEKAEQPDHPFTLFNLGSVYQELGRPGEALKMFRRSLNGSEPMDSIVRKLYALIAQCHRALGHKEEALEACRNGLDLFADDIELLFQEGVALSELGDTAGAAECWESCLNSSPGEHFASVNTGLAGHITRHNLASAYCKLGKVKEAEAQWRIALQDRPVYEPAWRGLLSLYLEGKHWSEIDRLADAVAQTRDGELPEALIRARLHLAQKSYEVGRKHLEAAIQRWPQALELRILLSHSLLQEGQDWIAAERTLRQILELDPHQLEANHNLMVLLKQQATA